jgi:ubiquinone/menaquinone biosynthesis C-methylase UbiE
MDISQQYNKLGPVYEAKKEAFYQTHPDNATAWIIKSLGDLKGLTILDIGCGTGAEAAKYQQAGAKVFGIDPSPTMVAAARKLVTQTEQIIEGDAEQIDFSDGMFDAVVSRFSLQYLFNFDLAYQEIHRVLKPHGQSALVVSHPLANMAVQKYGVYGSQTMIEAPIFNSEVKEKYPSHTFNDYLSPEFFRLFDLLSVEEEPSDSRVNLWVPGYLAYSAIRK